MCFVLITGACRDGKELLADADADFDVDADAVDLDVMVDAEDEQPEWRGAGEMQPRMRAVGETPGTMGDGERERHVARWQVALSDDSGVQWRGWPPYIYSGPGDDAGDEESDGLGSTQPRLTLLLLLLL